MSNWEHKAVVGLAIALVKHIRYARDGLADTAQLIGIYKAAKRAATVVEPGPELLIHMRASCATRLWDIGDRPSIFQELAKLFQADSLSRCTPFRIQKCQIRYSADPGGPND
jgi:hypothetical protein